MRTSAEQLQTNIQRVDPIRIYQYVCYMSEVSRPAQYALTPAGSIHTEAAVDADESEGPCPAIGRHSLSIPVPLPQDSRQGPPGSQPVGPQPPELSLTNSDQRLGSARHERSTDQKPRGPDRSHTNVLEMRSLNAMRAPLPPARPGEDRNAESAQSDTSRIETKTAARDKSEVSLGFFSDGRLGVASGSQRRCAKGFGRK